VRVQYLQPPVRRAGRIILLVLAGLFAFLVLMVVALRWVNPPVTAFMLQQATAAERVYEWVPLGQINESALLAVIAAEDQRFTEHRGIDFDSIGKAIAGEDRKGSLRGASTITQQLVKNLFLWPGRNIVRKGIEAVLSVLVDALLPKRRILELYLNVVEFGPGIYGVGAASRVYYGKLPAQLSYPDAALLAAVLPNPKQLKVAEPSAYVRERQAWILGQMGRLQREGIVAGF
jgi:monofunctional biosynthetic peptidoglycan transglycosylase